MRNAPLQLPALVRHLDMGALALAGFGANYAKASLSPLQETVRVSLAFSDNQMALLQGAALALPVIIAAVPIGLMVDRVSRVRLLLAFACLQVLAAIITFVADTFLVLFAARALAGLAAAGVVMTAPSLLSDLYAADKRGRATTALSVGMLAGTSVAFALGGALLVVFSGETAWRLAFVAMSALPLLLVFIVLPMREPRRSGVARAGLTLREALGELSGYRNVIIPIVGGAVMVGIADGAALVWAAPAFARSFGLEANHVGALIAVALLVAGLVGPVIGGVMADVCQRSGGARRTALALGLISVASLPAGAFVLATNAPQAAIGFCAFITIGAMIGVANTALFTVVIPNEIRGLCTALKSTAGLILGVGLAPLLVSLISTALGGERALSLALAIVCVSGSLVGAFAFLIGRRAIPADKGANVR